MTEIKCIGRRRLVVLATEGKDVLIQIDLVSDDGRRKTLASLALTRIEARKLARELNKAAKG